LREYLDPAGTGDYQWDRLDGYDSEDKGSLNAHPDLQAKVRRVVTQGFIDQEDWNGVSSTASDPKYLLTVVFRTQR
jgi:hypothetical protein